MKQQDLLDAIGEVDPRYLKSLDLLSGKEPKWRRVMKRSVKLAATAAAVVLTVGVIAVAMLLQNEPWTEREPADHSSKTAEKETIHVVTDLGTNWSLMRGTADMEDIAELHLQSAMEYFDRVPEGFEIELEVLPTGGGDLKSRLTAIRTEIMSGGGPDVFILSRESRRGSRDDLFPNPEKAMLDGFFLPLDEYLEEARVMEWEKLTPAVMAGGKTKEGQMVLPMFYTYGTAKVTGTISTDSLPGTWEEALSWSDPTVREGYGKAASCSFRNILGKVIDYEKMDLAFSEEELYTRVTEALSIYGETVSTSVEGFSVWPQDPTFFGKNSMIGEAPDWGATEGETASFFPIHNTDGEVTASITTYAAINSNTDHGAESFAVLDVLLSKEFQSGQLFWQGRENFGSTICVFSAAKQNGVPVHEDLLREDSPVCYDYYITDDYFPAYDAVRSQITEAHLVTNVDDTLDDLYWNCWKIRTSDAKPETKDKVIRETVSKAYASIKMMLAES